MTAPLPNPFQFETSAAPTLPASSAAEQATGQLVPSDCPVAVPFTPTKEFMDALYLEITRPEPPLFLRKPSPAFMKALFRLGEND